MILLLLLHSSSPSGYASIYLSIFRSRCETSFLHLPPLSALDLQPRMSSDKPVKLIYGQRLTTFKHKNSNLSKDHAAFKETSNPNPCNEALIPKHTPGTYLTPQLKSYTPYTHHILLNRTERNLNSRMAIYLYTVQRATPRQSYVTYIALQKLLEPLFKIRNPQTLTLKPINLKPSSL